MRRRGIPRPQWSKYKKKEQVFGGGGGGGGGDLYIGREKKGL